MDEAQRLYYVGRYEDAAAMALVMRTASPDDLASYELRTSALHFQIKRLLGDTKDRERALKECASCAQLMADMAADITQGQTLARARLVKDPADVATLFYLGKIDLNHVWLQLGTLGRRTAWSEYREARRSIDAVLKAKPSHVRARVAHAWIEYIVDTRVPFGLQWVLGGGNKNKALVAVREAAAADAEFYVRTEARFALWEMLAKEKKSDEAVKVAETLFHDFPANQDLARFIAEHGKGKVAAHP